jgi:ABC-type glycerol-3-phosphate transport system permease component
MAVRAGQLTTPHLPTSSTRSSWSSVVMYTILTIGAILSVVPFIYMLMTSLKTYGSLISNNFWPWAPFGNEPLQWGNYAEAVQTIGWDKSWGMFLVFRYALNSIIVAGGTVGGVLITSVLAAYAFAQMKFPGKNVLFILLLTTVMLPSDLTIVPKAVMMYQLHNPFGPGPWYNTYLALIVPFLSSVFGIFLLRQFFMQIPKELFDAAVIDGAGHVRYLFTIVIPLSRPAVVSVALINFIWAWDSFKWPLLVTRDNSMRVLAVGLQQFLIGEGGTKTHLMMAFSAIVIIPVIVGYLFMQKYFTEGIATTGIKG